MTDTLQPSARISATGNGAHILTGGANLLWIGTSISATMATQAWSGIIYGAYRTWHQVNQFRRVFVDLYLDADVYDPTPDMFSTTSSYTTTAKKPNSANSWTGGGTGVLGFIPALEIAGEASASNFVLWNCEVNVAGMAGYPIQSVFTGADLQVALLYHRHGAGMRFRSQILGADPGPDRGPELDTAGSDAVLLSDYGGLIADNSNAANLNLTVFHKASFGSQGGKYLRLGGFLVENRSVADGLTIVPAAMGGTNFANWTNQTGVGGGMFSDATMAEAIAAVGIDHVMIEVGANDFGMSRAQAKAAAIALAERFEGLGVSRITFIGPHHAAGALTLSEVRAMSLGIQDAVLHRTDNSRAMVSLLGMQEGQATPPAYLESSQHINQSGADYLASLIQDGLAGAYPAAPGPRRQLRGSL